ncbi:MAG: DUF302 domain-containing protein [Pseudomonadota bacterium]
MRFVVLFLLSLTACTPDQTSMDTDVWMKFESADPVEQTMDRLEEAIRSQGLTVFTRIDHAANAASAGLELAPNQVLIFGNPKAGTQLMNVDPDVGLDLPMRALVRAGESGGSVIVMHDPAAVATRYGIRTLDALLGKMRSTLRGLAKAAAESA